MDLHLTPLVKICLSVPFVTMKRIVYKILTQVWKEQSKGTDQWLIHVWFSHWIHLNLSPLHDWLSICSYRMDLHFSPHVNGFSLAVKRIWYRILTLVWIELHKALTIIDKLTKLDCYMIHYSSPLTEWTYIWVLFERICKGMHLFALVQTFSYISFSFSCCNLSSSLVLLTINHWWLVVVELTWK